MTELTDMLDIPASQVDTDCRDDGVPKALAAFAPQPKASMARSNAILGVMFVVGIASVYGIKMMAEPERASAKQLAVESQVDLALIKMNADNSDDLIKIADTASLVSTFYYDASQRQIPIERLTGTPFVYKLPRLVNFQPNEAQPEFSIQFVKAKRLSDAKIEVRKLTLQSVMTGRDGATAIISNNLLACGQTIRGWTVEKISSREVVLEWNGHRYTLEMAQ